MKPTLEIIQKSASDFAAARMALVTTVQEYDDAVQLARDRFWPKIKVLANETAAVKTELVNLIDHARDLFADPRTIIVDGIKIGLGKGRGAIEFDDEAKVIARIEKVFPDLTESLIKTSKSLKKNDLKELPASTLARLGVTVEDTDVQVVVKAIAGDVDKLVAAILKEANK